LAELGELSLDRVVSVGISLCQCGLGGLLSLRLKDIRALVPSRNEFREAAKERPQAA
jgi:hypothetical protein